MLYLDASALVKGYLLEKGTDRLLDRLADSEQVFTSVISYAEIHASLARKLRSSELSAREYRDQRESFEWDWRSTFNVVELNIHTMEALPRLVEIHPLRPGDAIHLSSAIWLKEHYQSESPRYIPEESVEFGVADKRLRRIAELCGFLVFNPEEEN